VSASDPFFNPSGDFSDPDPFLSRLIASWLSQYARLSAANPALASAVQQRAGDTHLVPIPGALFDQLQKRSLDVSGLEALWHGVQEQAFGVTDAIAKKASDLQVARNYPALAGLVKTFAAALEKGDVAEALQHVSNDYYDFEGRGKAEFGDSLKQLVDTLGPPRIVFADTPQLRAVNSRIYAQITGSWEATKMVSGAVEPSGHFKLDVFFERDSDGQWRIASATT
jgi:hypothetical protein